MKDVSLEDLTEIRPFNDEQFREAMKRIVAFPMMPKILEGYFPGVPWEGLKAKALALKSIREFQETFITQALTALLAQTSAGLTMSGAENNPHDQRYVFISNHRDIIMDPTLFIRSIYYLGYGSPQICLGDNLLTSELIYDLVKSNKGVTVKRNLAQRELLRWSYVLSECIRAEIVGGEDSIWIAQREGRAKDGNDETSVGVLKMLALSGKGSFIENIEALHIVPVAMSYEYDPSDVEKARENYFTQKTGTYQKAPGEDTKTMIRGILGYKGGIHVEVCKEVKEAVARAKQIHNKGDQARLIAEELDRQIQLNYRLWPSNYIAYDMSQPTATMSAHYTTEKRDQFLTRLEKRVKDADASDEDREGIRHAVLEMYANPVRNHLKRKA